MAWQHTGGSSVSTIPITPTLHAWQGQMALTKQQRIVKRLLVKDPEMSWTAAAEKAGYMTPSASAIRLKANPSLRAAIAAARQGHKVPVKVDREYVTSTLVEILEHSMEEGPVLMWNEDTQEYKQVGYRELDAKNARETAKLLGTEVGMFKKEVKLSQDKPFQVEGKLPDSLQELMDEEYGKKN